MALPGERKHIIADDASKAVPNNNDPVIASTGSDIFQQFETGGSNLLTGLNVCGAGTEINRRVADVPPYDRRKHRKAAQDEPRRSVERPCGDRITEQEARADVKPPAGDDDQQ